MLSFLIGNAVSKRLQHLRFRQHYLVYPHLLNINVSDKGIYYQVKFDLWENISSNKEQI